MKCKAIVVHQIGGPEVLRYEDVEVPAPGPGCSFARIASESVGPAMVR